MITEELLILHGYKHIKRNGITWYSVPRSMRDGIYHNDEFRLSQVRCPYCEAPLDDKLYHTIINDSRIPHYDTHNWHYRVFTCGVMTAFCAGIPVATTGQSDRCAMATMSQDDII